MPKIKEVLAEKNISQNQLAKIVHQDFNSITKVVINNICNFKVIPSKDLLNKICLILNTTPNDLYFPEELDYKNCFVENRGGIPPLKLKSSKTLDTDNKKIHTISLRIDKEIRKFLSDSEVMKNYGVKTFSEFVRLLIKEKIEEVKENG